MASLIYFDGAFRPEHEATVSVRSRALNYGLGCFAGIRGYRTDDGQQVHVFRLERHVRRLERSARILCLRLPGTVSEVAGSIVELLRRNEMRGDTYIRPIVFANSNELAPVLDPDTSSTAIFCMPLGRYLSAEPIDVCVSSWRRIRETALPARAKATGGYLNSALARKEAIDNGYAEAIFLTEDGLVSEGSAEHVFLVRDGQLISPPSTSDNLDGITRQSLIALATEDLGIPFVERPIGRTELYVADEMFLCGTAAEVSAVNSVDDREIPCPGPMTTAIAEEYHKAIRGQSDRYKDWVEHVS